MFRQTISWLNRSLGSYPVRPVTKRRRRRGAGVRTNPYGRMFWRNLMDEDHARASFWVSDFRHKHLVKTGTDYPGKVPVSPQPGMYQGMRSDTRHILGGHAKPQRESRHLPVTEVTPRVVYEHMNEQRITMMRKMRSDRRRVEELKAHEFWGWYTKLQRVRGRWCKEQGVGSRGVYGPAVDASELWG